MRKGKLAALVREVALFKVENPELESVDDIRDGVTQKIREKYSASWAVALIALLELLLPMILNWLDEEEK